MGSHRLTNPAIIVMSHVMLGLEELSRTASVAAPHAVVRRQPEMIFEIVLERRNSHLVIGPKVARL